jgi:hypothetical protein
LANTATASRKKVMNSSSLLMADGRHFPAPPVPLAPLYCTAPSTFQACGVFAGEA